MAIIISTNQVFVFCFFFSFVRPKLPFKQRKIYRSGLVSVVCFKLTQPVLNENLYFIGMSYPKQWFPYFFNHGQVSHTVVSRYVRLIRIGLVERILREGVYKSMGACSWK